MDDAEISDLAEKIIAEGKIPLVIQPGHRRNEYIDSIVATPSFHKFTDPIIDTSRIEKTPKGIAAITFSTAYALLTHRNQRRVTGGLYFRHCYNVMMNVAEDGWDAVTIAAAAVHDAPERRGKNLVNEAIRLPRGDRPVLIYDGIPNGFKDRFCRSITDHLAQYEQRLTEEELQSYYTSVWELTHVKDVHYLAYLESIRSAEARGIKMGDSADNCRDTRPIAGWSGSTDYSGAIAVANQFKGFFNIHSSANHMKRYANSTRDKTGESLFNGYARLCNTVRSEFERLAKEFAAHINPELAAQIDGELERYVDTPLMRKMTYESSEDPSSFRATIKRYVAALAEEHDSKTLPETLYMDCRIGSAAIKNLYLPEGCSRFRDVPSHVEPIKGLTYKEIIRANEMELVRLASELPE